MESLDCLNVSNKSSSLAKFYPYEEAYWIISETIILFVGGYFLYLFCALSIFAFKRKLAKETKILLSLTITSLGLGICRVISNQFVAFLGWQKDLFCVYSVSFSIGVYYLSVAAVYIFLWMRQNYFYQKPLLRNLLNKKLRFISKATLAVLVLFGLIFATLLQIPEVTGWDYRATSTGCRDRNDKQDFELILFFLEIVVLMSQIAFMGLLIYPVVTMRKSRQDLSAKSQLWISPSQPEYKLQRGVDLTISQKSTQLQIENDFPVSIHQLGGNYKEILMPDFCDHRSDLLCNLNSLELNNELENQVPTCFSEVTVNKIFRKKNETRASRSHKSSVEVLPDQSKDISKKNTLRKKQNKSRVGPTIVQSKRAKELSQLIKKVFILALLCVVSDVLTTLVQLILVMPELPYLALYDVNLAINITCILISFKDWRSMISSFACAKKCKFKSNRCVRQDSSRPMISGENVNMMKEAESG